MTPDVADAVTGSAFDGASGIPRPGPLGCGVVVQFNIAALPGGLGAFVEVRVVLATAANPARVKRGVLPNPVWMSEVRVLERGLHDRCAAFLQIAFQRLNRRYQCAFVCPGPFQDEIPTLRPFGFHMTMVQP